ncbi:MAG: N-acetylmuramoyl-L-alanine amidase [Burkholderiales bacterium]
MRILIVLLFMPAAVAEAQTVAVDVGHFFGKPGATSARGRIEFEFNRDLALEIGLALRRQGAGAVPIGADGGMVRLSARTVAATGADFFLSVHHDSVQPHYLEEWNYEGVPLLFSDRFAGFSLFVSRKNPHLGQSVQCASAMGAALRAAGFAPSLYHAEPIPGESKPFADRANGVHYYDNLIVLKTARSPAVLLEAGVIVNRGEELRLRSEEVHKRIAAAVALGLDRCLRRVRVGAAAPD